MSLPVVLLLPGAGSSSAIFTKWIEDLSPFATVIAPDYPGHGRHLGKPLTHTMAELVNFVVDYSRSIDRNSPFVIFGHSFGALLAFEVAQRLKKLGFSIAGLIFAGAKAPHDHDRRSSNWHLLPDAELIINLKELGGIPAQIFDETALIQMLLPVFRADFLLLAQYSHKAEFKARFDAKVTVLGGSNDSLVSAESLMRWNEIIDDRVSIKMLDGGHFFILEQATRILWMIKNWIRDAQEGKARV